MGATFGGTTAVGGGPIAFAIMTMVFNIPIATARDFSLMCQCAGAKDDNNIALLNINSKYVFNTRLEQLSTKKSACEWSSFVSLTLKVDVFTLKVFLKIWQSSAKFHLFSIIYSFSNGMTYSQKHQANQPKKYSRCFWDSNPRPKEMKYGRHKQIHRAL